ncbi:hypothetical protein FPANT_12673 [Fusarium pseudoanthophilum]|uniref:Uncharacterized protein n=1 Tax=Fusarium pseudoanthophilum TaxID=48495 RepID=A0A8H5KGX3_9HYPO|nr:hypothetical protein FPANT_12673 [Fusarium pseudoanthophilum]
MGYFSIIRVIKESEYILNRDARNSLGYTKNNPDDQDELNDSGNTGLQQKEYNLSTIQYLDFLHPDLFSGVAPFDFNDIKTSTSDRFLNEPNQLCHGLLQMDATNLISPGLDPLPIHFSGAIFDKTPGLVDSSSLGIGGNANAQWPLTPVLGEWVSVEPTVLSRECETVASAASGDVTSSAPVTGHSARRQPRSPSPEDIVKRSAPSVFCFRMEVPESSSSRPAKKMRRPDDEQRRKRLPKFVRREHVIDAVSRASSVEKKLLVLSVFESGGTPGVIKSAQAELDVHVSVSTEWWRAGQWQGFNL